ncbi:hypothetical protein V8C37DRAFT_384818, partial [Trichoderma ceciliae]
MTLYAAPYAALLLLLPLYPVFFLKKKTFYLFFFYTYLFPFILSSLANPRANLLFGCLAFWRLFVF